LSKLHVYPLVMVPNPPPSLSPAPEVVQHSTALVDSATLEGYMFISKQQGCWEVC
jgi:hypothetical protein